MNVNYYCDKNVNSYTAIYKYKELILIIKLKKHFCEFQVKIQKF